MAQYVVEDASFLVSVLNPKDNLHSPALETLRILDGSKDPVTYVLPEIAVCETAFTLMKLGVSPETIRDRINKLSMLPRVIIVNTDVMTVLRYISRYYNSLTLSRNHRSITKTHDYLIACTCKDFNGLLLSGDAQMLEVLGSQEFDCYDFSDEESRKKLTEKLQ